MQNLFVGVNCIHTYRHRPCSCNSLHSGAAAAIVALFGSCSNDRSSSRDSDSAAAAAFNVKSDGKWLADLFMLGRQRLAACGVRRVYGGGDCTVADPQRFYSYRRDKITGRMAALIWLDGV